MHTHVKDPGSPCQSSRDDGNNQITQHALKVLSVSRILKLDTIRKKKRMLMLDTTDTEEAEEEHTYRSSTARSVQRHIPHAKHILFVRMRVQLLLKNNSNIESLQNPGYFFRNGSYGHQ